MVTIKDIARTLGVSVGTVSKALNGRDDVGDELRARIIDTARELRYEPDPIARRLVTKRSRTLGVFMLDRQGFGVRRNFGWLFLDGILRGAAARDYDLVLFSNTDDTRYERSYIDICRSRRVDAAIIVGLRGDDRYLEDVLNAPIPVALIDTEVSGGTATFVSSDNKAGAALALEHLAFLGHEKVATLRAPFSYPGRLRYEAWAEFAAARGRYRDDYIRDGDFTPESGMAAAAAFASMKDMPTAIFAASDLMAIGLIRGFERLGVRVPEDVSIVGFDDIPNADLVGPALTTVAQDTLGIGQAALDAVLDELDSGSRREEILVAPRLVVRRSCAAPGGAPDFLTEGSPAASLGVRRTP
ncbi:MAG: LacI family DNA-binding transcriptional regulator [Spirochaetia bacterium]|nr:LacI family DNA-binding transcriptional regulator [Spirochaetia bacterium]